MHVVATAGHVDHGKSTLVRQLTGMEPDRLAEERDRGLTIELGFAWTRLADTRLAFVDVPGHHRFVSTMLAGLGPVPAVMMVVAADEGWMPQSQEHLDALHALGVQHGLLVVTKSDRADPAPAMADAATRLAATSLGTVPAVAVSGRTSAGLPELRRALADVVAGLPGPDLDADVRLWVDRAFTVRGAGTVVTGTLAAGTIRAGDVLAVSGAEREVRVRGLHTLGQPTTTAAAVARVALNLQGIEATSISRGDAVLTPRRWTRADVVDVRVRRAQAGELNREQVLHTGSAAVPVRVRALGSDSARLRLHRPLPLRVGDGGLLRDPGLHLISAGIEVLDIDPPSLSRRGAGAARAAELRGADAAALSISLIRRRRFVRADELAVAGLPPAGRLVSGWAVDGAVWEELIDAARDRVDQWHRVDPVAAGAPVQALRRELAVPSTEIMLAVLREGGLVVDGGIARHGGQQLPARVIQGLDALDAHLAERPFQAPDAGQLNRWGLGARELAAAERLGRLTRITDHVVLGAEALAAATTVLRTIPQPFTVSQARVALNTTRRVAIPLLERLDSAGFTRKRPDDTRVAPPET
ncbi:selenocysteine-specific elongation factor [Tamaricihabitans halophyticus]|uniref:Selenocysteine-specific elongation factor n=1 Tax=Tamaricihabitans halophyticus TaxID=1262583 RepID=A0A4R2Q1W1_9PSEU|nr:selenocysteine-specific translation elongation factor [Tamaricihabitans halophyticus]TCP42633.1 selenocysteine-specific elongation factor [Tamaricihabitans halophyticus]